MMIKAVVFDLDDTLISEKQYILSGFNKVSCEISRKYNLDYKKVYRKMNEFFKEDSKSVFNRTLGFFNINYSNAEISELINIYRNHNPKIEFYDDVIPTINKLKAMKIKLGIITDGYKETQLKKIEALRCRDIFDEIIITDELGREFWKPNEKAYKLMAKRLKVNFDEMIYVGDNEEKDFKGANNLGIITFKIERREGIYKNMKSEKEYIPKYIIKDIKSINELLNKIKFK